MHDDRLIDLDLLKRKVEAMQACEPHYASNFLNDALNPSTEWWCIEDIIDSIPVIDAQPVKRGRWIIRGDYASCSLCNGSSGTQFDGVEPVPRFTAYCPNCGAKMDGGDAK